MNTEITTTTPGGGTEIVRAETPAEFLGEWVGTMQSAGELARALSVSQLVPQHFRGEQHVADAAIAIMRGAALGWNPLDALDALFVVHGKVGMFARSMVAVVLSRGHRVWTEKSTDTQVTVCGQRKGSERVEQSVWTIERAKRAGYTTNAKYASNPQEMLYAKAAAEICRRIAPDALMGMAYTVEDLELEGGLSGTTQTGTGTRKVSRKPRATTVDEARARAPVEVEATQTPEPVEEPALVDPQTGEILS